MSEQVERFGGTVAQLTGDGLFAVFGAPDAHEDDSERAVRAARGIQAALTRYGGEVEAAYGIKLAGRVGINTGPVMLVGGDLPDQARYNALGDTVNVAARLQSLAGEGGIAVGPATARQIERRFALEALGEVELKGKSASVQAFRVIAELDVEPTAAVTPFVARASELARCGGCWTISSTAAARSSRCSGRRESARQDSSPRREASGLTCASSSAAPSPTRRRFPTGRCASCSATGSESASPSPRRASGSS